MDSDSEDERQNGYTPILAEKLTNTRLGNSPSLQRPQSASQWQNEGVSLYTNELFHDEDEEAGVTSPSQRANLNASMGRKGQSLAAKRQQRLEQPAYAPNSLMKSTSQRVPAPGSPTSVSRTADANPASPFRPATLPPPSVGTPANGQSSGIFRGLKATYDPNEGEEDPHGTILAQQQARAGGMGPQYAAAYAAQQQQQLQMQQQQMMQQQQLQQMHSLQRQQAPMLDLSDMENFLMQPGPKSGPIMCYIVRDKGNARMYPRYMLFLEDGKRFLLAARKRKKQTTSNYIISLDMDDLGRDSESFFGKVRANFVGTEFTIYDNGEKNQKAATSNQPAFRQELGAITYQYNVLGTRGPRKMMAAIPAVDNSGNILYHAHGEADSILERVRARRQLDELVVMGNKPPRWNDELNAYCLNFNGRVTEASVKNFQLVADDNLNHVILQFGKIGKNTFTMDYQWPISAFQAFAICISSFDNKLACE